MGAIYLNIRSKFFYNCPCISAKSLWAFSFFRDQLTDTNELYRLSRDTFVHYITMPLTPSPNTIAAISRNVQNIVFVFSAHNWRSVMTANTSVTAIKVVRNRSLNNSSKSPKHKTYLLESIIFCDDLRNVSIANSKLLLMVFIFSK
jgi:hypothetical protein